MYNHFKICLPPYFPNRIEKVSKLCNFVKVGGCPPPNTPSSNGPVCMQKIQIYCKQSCSQSPRSSVGGIVGLWEKAQKNAWNSLHFITIGSSTLGKRAIFKLPNDGAIAKSRKCYCPKELCP